MKITIEDNQASLEQAINILKKLRSEAINNRLFTVKIDQILDLLEEIDFLNMER